MSAALIEAAAELADLLSRENDALRALDLPRAAAMLADKERALDALVAIQRGPGTTASLPTMARSVGLRLKALSEENRRLLERGIAAQGRVLAMLASAAKPPASGYCAGGKLAYASRHPAFALSARA